MLSRPPVRRRSTRLPAPLLLCVVCASCAATQRTPTSPTGGASELRSDEEFSALRASYDPFSGAGSAAAGTPKSRAGASSDEVRARVAARGVMVRYQLGEVSRELAAGRSDAAWDALEKILPLWDADELRQPIADSRLESAASEMERAFRRRGSHRQVITALAVEIALGADSTAARARWGEVTRWLRGDAHPTDCAGGACQALIEDLEATVALWPSPFVVDALAVVYKQRLIAMPDLTGIAGGGRRLAALVGSAQRTGFDLVRLYLRVSRPDQALAEARMLAGQPGDDEHLRDALERYLAPAAVASDVLGVAAAFDRDPADRPVGERICHDAVARFPDAAEPVLCLGEIAAQLEQTGVAIRAFERGRALDPTRRPVWENLAVLHQARLFQLVAEERTSELEEELATVEKFHAEAARRFPGEPLAPSLAGAFFEVGRGFYNAGRVDDAARYLRRSLDTEPTPYAYELLGVLELKRDRAPAAERLLQDGFAVAVADHHGSAVNVYWLAKITRDLGDVYDQLGDGAHATEFRKKSADVWGAVARATNLGADEVSEAELEHGKLLYDLGDHVAAEAAFDRAIDAAPERGATYADLLVFLIPRRERELALDAYHRALGRGAISEYLKVYCTLWILELQRREKQPEDPLGRTFLDGITGARWYDDLARWEIGRATDAEMAAHADTPQKRCELTFYQAMRALSDGRSDEARRLWRAVLDTHMMAFFEFDMASFYLRHPSGVVGGATLRAAAHLPRL